MNTWNSYIRLANQFIEIGAAVVPPSPPERDFPLGDWKWFGANRIARDTDPAKNWGLLDGGAFNSAPPKWSCNATALFYHVRVPGSIPLCHELFLVPGCTALKLST